LVQKLKRTARKEKGVALPSRREKTSSRKGSIAEKHSLKKEGYLNIASAGKKKIL